MAFTLFGWSCLFSQHYGVIGAGGVLDFYNSAELNDFRRTYNSVNGPNMNQHLSGFNNYVGLCFEGGYRYMGYRLTTSLLLGWQRLRGLSTGQFNNGDSRIIELHSDAFYFEAGLGRLWGDFFLSGLFALFANRNFTIESRYSNVSGLDYIERLDGTYKARTPISADIGLAIGLRRHPLFLIAKVTHPVFSSDSDARLRSSDPEKAVDGSDLFPEDFIKFSTGEPYSGVRNNLDGWKVALTFGFAFKMAI
jgi:hypothetical protein